MTDLTGLRLAVLGEHYEGTSRWQQAIRGLELVQSGLRELAALGHAIEVSVSGAQAPSAPLEWPKMLYRDGEPPRVFNEPAEVPPGWYVHPGLEELHPTEHEQPGPGPVEPGAPLALAPLAILALGIAERTD